MYKRKNILVGTRYFDNNKKVYKVVKVKNADTFSLATIDGKERFTKTREELAKDYTKLTPNGYMIISVVENKMKEDLIQKDVVVALYRYKQSEKEKQGNLPYCVCRQNVVNVFYQYAGSNIRHCGMSMSVDTCPTNVNYELMIACDNVYNNVAIAVYMDDDLDEILKLFRHKPYDIVLSSGINNNVRGTVGYVSTLKELLTQEEFSKDFYKAFNITEVDFHIEYNKENLLLKREQTMIFEDYFKIEMFDAFVIPFDYTIRLKDIKKKYIMVYSNVDKQVYIIIYTEGKMYNEYVAEEIRQVKNQAALFNQILIK